MRKKNKKTEKKGSVHFYVCKKARETILSLYVSSLHLQPFQALPEGTEEGRQKSLTHSYSGGDYDYF